MKRAIAAVPALLLAGCWSVAHVDDAGPVRFVVYSSPLGICGATDSSLETKEGRTLVAHAWHGAGRHAATPDGAALVVVAWTRDRFHQVHVVDLAALKVVAAFDLPEEEDAFSSGPRLGAWSPEGRRLVCESHLGNRSGLTKDRGSALTLLTLAPEGPRAEPLFQDAEWRVQWVRWSPDGASLAFLARQEEGESTTYALFHVIPGTPPALRPVESFTYALPPHDLAWEGGSPRRR